MERECGGGTLNTFHFKKEILRYNTISVFLTYIQSAERPTDKSSVYYSIIFAVIIVILLTKKGQKSNLTLQISHNKTCQVKW